MWPATTARNPQLPHGDRDRRDVQEQSRERFEVGGAACQNDKRSIAIVTVKYLRKIIFIVNFTVTIAIVY